MAECRCKNKMPILVIGNYIYEVCLKCGQFWTRDRTAEQHYKCTATDIRLEIGGGWKTYTVLDKQGKKHFRSYYKFAV